MNTMQQLQTSSLVPFFVEMTHDFLYVNLSVTVDYSEVQIQGGICSRMGYTVWPLDDVDIVLFV